MSVDLNKQQQDWLERQVQDGKLPSIEDGVRLAVADMMTIAEDDLAWAEKYVEAARDDLRDGNVVEGADAIERLRTRAAT